MSILIAKGDMFDSAADVRVNPVNCVGIMGKGLALEFKTRYPYMFDDYILHCKAKRLKPGGLYIAHEGGSMIVNFATKDHWKYKSEYGYIDIGLRRLQKVLCWHAPHTIVQIPALGCGLGGLEWEIVLKMIRKQFANSRLNIDVYKPK